MVSRESTSAKMPGKDPPRTEVQYYFSRWSAPMRKLLSLASCVVTALALVAAQERPAAQSSQTSEPIQGPRFRTGIDLVAVDVSVVDRNGRPVDDLLAPDFVVKIDGVTRRVVSADLVKVDAEAARKPQVDKTQSFYTSNLAPPNGRRIVFAVDQVRIGPGTLRPVLDAASRFLDHLTPLDQVSLVAYPDPGVRVDFTNDKVRLRRALQRLVGHPQRSVTRRHNIGVSEARAIVERSDQFVYAAVVERECRVSQDERQNQRCLQEIDRESDEVVHEARDDAENSLNGLRQLLQQLAKVEGPKLMILLSEGFMVDELELRSLVAMAGEARTSINVLVVDLRQTDVTLTNMRPSEAQDRRLHVQSLEGLAAMSRGSLFRIAGTGEPVFERLASEISAYYILGVEQQPSDSVGDRHRIDVEVRRRDVTIRSRQAFVLSPARLAGRARAAPEAALRETLSSPFAVSGLPLRATTFAQQDPQSGKVRLVVAAQVGEAGAQPGEYTVGYIVMNDQGQVAASFLEERMTLSPGSGSPNEALRFVGGVVVDPGTYSLRLAVIDKEGRRGSIVRDVSAWKMAGEPFAMGDLVIGPVPPQGKGIAVQVEPYVNTDGVAAYLELYSTTEATWKGTTVAFEIADSEDAPALTSLDASVEPGRQTTWRIATGIVPARTLPPGRYVARAKIAHDGTAVGVLVRPLVLEREARADAGAPAAVAAGPSAITPSMPKFDPAIALERDLLDAMLAMVERRSPDLKTALVEARAGRFDAAAREAFNGGDLVVGAFMDGVDLFSKGRLDEAAAQLQAAAGPRREFFPAAFFLGACYAAVGRDQDAAGVWQLALGQDPRPPAAYTVAADARLRTGQPQSAIDILKPAYDRDPSHDEIARRLAMAYAMTNRHAEALTVLDGYLLRHPDDQDMLFAAIVSQYEAARGGQILSSIDRDRVQRYAAAYQGPNRTLVDKYLETMR
jgi:VWFA-related protein